MPHTILSNVVSAYKSKFSKSASAPAPSTSSNASSTSSDSSTSPAVVANVNATSYMLSSTSGDSNTSSHHILSELISEHTDKQHKHDATTPASSTSEPSATANATATANSTADGGDDYYSAPCSSGPVPSQYEAFEEVSILLCIEKFHQKICMPVCLPATSCLLVTSFHCIHNALQYSNPVMPCIQCCACKGVMPTFCL